MRRVSICLALTMLLAACTSSGDAASIVTDPSSSTHVAPTPRPKPKRSPKPVVDPNNPVAPGFWPSSVAYWDEQTGLLAGKVYSSRGSNRGTGAIALTRDGGASWRITYSGPVQATDLSVLAPGTAVATVGGNRHLQLIASRDGGRTWKVLPGSEGLSGASFSAPDDGWAVSGYGEGLVHRSADAWARIKDPCGGRIIDVSFPEDGDGRGWLACSWEGSAGQEPKAVYETSDGGASWQVRSSVIPGGEFHGEGLSGSGYLSGISFLPDGTGWLIESRGTFYSTEDGGASWQEHIGFQRPEIAFGTSVWRVDRHTGFALEDRRDMVLHVTHDGGSTWARLASFHPPW